MFDLLRRNVEMFGSVLFLGTMPPRPSDFDDLAKLGYRIEPSGEGGDGWASKFIHPDYGEATVIVMKNPMMPPPYLIEMDPWLSPAERMMALGCRSMVSVRMTGKKNNILRDRKLLLRVMFDLMGQEGVVCLDHSAERFWSRDELQEELAHDADLDIQSLFTVHGVTADEPAGPDEEPDVLWYHTHGLAALGIWDIDMIRPKSVEHPSFIDHVRVLAFAMLAGDAKPGGRFEIASPGGGVLLVPAAKFMAEAGPKWTELREDPDGEHNEKRVVLCDPSGGGFLGLFGRKITPARWIRREMDERALHNFTREAGELMADRASKTYTLLQQYAKELEPLDRMVLAKIGYATDGDPDFYEFLWFEVKAFGEQTVQATLLSQPHDIAAMNEGDEGAHQVADMNDWGIMTALGMTTPRNRTAVRVFRENREEILAAIAEHAE